MNILQRLIGTTAPADAEAPVDWEAVFHEQLPRIYNYFRFRGCEDALAEDLAAETFEKAWRGRATYAGARGGAAAWLVGIARNTAASHFRAERPALSLEDAERAASTLPGPEDLLAAGAERERLRGLLAALPTADRELVALKYGAGLTNRAIARQTGLSESNVGTRLHRIVQSLRSRLLAGPDIPLEEQSYG